MKETKFITPGLERGALPFETPPSAHEWVTVGDEKTGSVRVPRFRELLNGEAIAYERFAKTNEALARLINLAREEGKRVGHGEIMLIAAMNANEFAAEFATILVQHRVNRNFTIEDTKRYSATLIARLGDFFSEELQAFQAIGVGRLEDGASEGEREEGDTPKPEATGVPSTGSSDESTQEK